MILPPHAVLDLLRKANDNARERMSVETKIKNGDVVRVLRNTCGASRDDGRYLTTWDFVRVDHVDLRADNEGKHVPAIIFNNGRTSQYMPAAEVELVDKCICAGPLRAIGCRCGYEASKRGEV